MVPGGGMAVGGNVWWSPRLICCELCREEMEVRDFLAVGALSGVSSCFSFSGVGTSACGGGPGSGIGWNRNSICRITLGAATQSIQPSSCLQGGQFMYDVLHNWVER